ncbi:MAG: thiamine diphosphokinase [Gaiella sp.]
MQEDRLVVVVASGATGNPQPEEHDALVIAADGGVDAARVLGLHVDVLVGDLDSATPQAVAAAEGDGVEVVRHPARKDATDLELALDEASARGAHRILVRLAPGGRLDHALSGFLLLAHERFAGTTIDAAAGPALIHVVRSSRTLTGAVGETVTLLPVGGPAHGVTASGLEYPLHGETLEAGSTRGVSNTFREPVAHVSVSRGVVLAIRPEADRTVA